MYTCFNGYYDTCTNECGPTFSKFSRTYWERSLFQRLRTLFKFDGLPEAGPNQAGWDLDAFLYGLYRCGFLTVFMTKKYGVVPPQPSTPYGIGLQYQPTGMMVQTPYFNFARPLKIGVECEVIKLTPDFQGVWDIISKYAEELMLNDIAIRMSQINARFAYAIAADSDKTAQSVKAIIEKLANGEPAVVYNAKLNKRPMDEKDMTEMPWQQFDRDLSKNFILPELLTARRTSLKDFYHEIGVKILPEKKERTITAEADFNDAETYNRKEVWNISLQESIKRVNKFAGTNITVEYVEPQEKDLRKALEGGDPDVAKQNRKPV